MPKFSQDKVNSLFRSMPDLRYLISKSFRKVTGICPYTIVRGTINSTEAGYQPQGAEPRDYTDFEQVITGFDPIIPDWEDSVDFPFDGTLDQRYKEAPKVKVITKAGVASFEEKGINPLGSVFMYEDGTEFKLDRRDGESDRAYQERLKKELGKELDRLALPENKKKDKWGRGYHEQLHTKYFVKKHGTVRYYSAYFISDEVSPVIKAWIGNEHFMSQSVQKQITMLILNTKTKEVFKGVEADGFEGNRGFFDRIDKYRLCLWRIPEFDLTYDLDNSTENEEKKRKGFRVVSFLWIERGLELKELVIFATQWTRKL